MRATRAPLLWALALAAIGAAAYWISGEGEWVEIEVPTLPRGEAARDRLYAAKQLARRLGAEVSAPKSFERLPPEGATLVLSSVRWNMFPGRQAALRDWVDRGGRLVVFQTAFSERGEAPPWMPIRAVAPARNGGTAPAPSATDEPPHEPRSPKGAPLPPGLLPGLASSGCAVYREPEGSEPAFGRARGFKVCGFPFKRLDSDDDAAWQLDASDGSVALRVPFGRGSVTSSAIDGAFDNASLLREDGALAFAALLQLRAGDAVWFVDDERRARFLVFLWERGWPALLLGAAALGLALWRAGVRFGPRLADASIARRSVGEQVRRTAGFIAEGGGAALHRAGVRALEEQARRSVPGYGALAAPADRSAAIARQAGADAAALGAALAVPANARRPAVAAAIAVLEHARRALLPRPGAARPPAP